MRGGFKSNRQRKCVMAKIGGGRRRRYTTKKSILSTKYQKGLDNVSGPLGLVPDPYAQKAALVLKGASMMGKSIKIQKTTVPVRGHYRKAGNRRIYVRPHRRTIKKKIKI